MSELTDSRIRLAMIAAVVFLLSGCARSAQPAAPSVTVPTTSGRPLHHDAITGRLRVEVNRDERWLRSTSYTPASATAIRVTGGRRLIVIHSICTGSADGHCQAIDVFAENSTQPVLHQDYTGVVKVSPAPNGFSVLALDYAKGDPLCCPSKPPATIVYTWMGSSFSRHGQLPGSP